MSISTRTIKQTVNNYFVTKHYNITTKKQGDMLNCSNYKRHLEKYTSTDGTDDRYPLLNFITDYVDLINLINSSKDVKLTEPGINSICSHLVSIVHYGDKDLIGFDLSTINTMDDLNELGCAIGELTSFRSYMENIYTVFVSNNDEENLDIASGRDNADTWDIFTRNNAIMAFYEKEMHGVGSYEWIANSDGSMFNPYITLVDRQYIDISDPDFINQY